MFECVCVLLVFETSLLVCFLNSWACLGWSSIWALVDLHASGSGSVWWLGCTVPASICTSPSMLAWALWIWLLCWEIWSWSGQSFLAGSWAFLNYIMGNFCWLLTTSSGTPLSSYPVYCFVLSSMLLRIPCFCASEVTVSPADCTLPEGFELWALWVKSCDLIIWLHVFFVLFVWYVFLSLFFVLVCFCIFWCPYHSRLVWAEGAIRLCSGAGWSPWQGFWSSGGSGLELIINFLFGVWFL